MEPIRLSKLMAQRGLCSRREADEYIEQGHVLVDGVVINVLGSRVLPNVDIKLNHEAQAAQAKRVTVILHKPVGFVSGQAEDGYTPASTLITLDRFYQPKRSKAKYPTQSHIQGLAPAGRLDIDSTGLLVLTQDGRIARQIIDQDSEIEKEYLVRVTGMLSYDDLDLLNHGLSLDGEPLKPAKVFWQNEDQLCFILKEGKKRQIRRMCELVGLKVAGLKRVRIGNISLADLPLGQWRYLESKETF
jgi:23S rRNA pseudouridine2604 synthase